MDSTVLMAATGGNVDRLDSFFATDEDTFHFVKNYSFFVFRCTAQMSSIASRPRPDTGGQYWGDNNRDIGTT